MEISYLQFADDALFSGQAHEQYSPMAMTLETVCKMSSCNEHVFI